VDLAQGLIARARRLYSEEPLLAEMNTTVYALDSTTIDLCISRFPWARLRSTKSAVKLHMLLSYSPCQNTDVGEDGIRVEDGSFKKRATEEDRIFKPASELHFQNGSDITTARIWIAKHWIRFRVSSWRGLKSVSDLRTTA